MIYGAVAAAMVLVLVMRRGSSSAASSSTDPNAGALTPVSSPAVDTGSYGGAGGGVDYGQQLSDFESQLSTVVGQAVSEGIAAGQVPAGSAGTDPTSQGGPAAVTINVGNGTGQQVGAGSASPSTGGPSAASRPHPALTRLLNQAQAAHQQMFRSPQSRTVLAKRAEAHPGWGPHTIAAGHQIRGHSTRF